MKGVDAQSQYNLGHLLLSFLDCFGNTFDYRAKAVSVRAVSVPASHSTYCLLCKAADLQVLNMSWYVSPSGRIIFSDVRSNWTSGSCCCDAIHHAY